MESRFKLHEQSFACIHPYKRSTTPYKDRWRGIAKYLVSVFVSDAFVNRFKKKKKKTSGISIAPKGETSAVIKTTVAYSFRNAYMRQ